MVEKMMIIYFEGAALALILMTVAGVAWFQAGLFGAYLKVKMSRGKKLLVRVLHPVQSYFVAGSLDEGFLVFKDRQRNERRIKFQPGCIDRACGVFWTQVDDEKNCMVQRIDGKAIDGFDAVKYDELYKRALYAPNTVDNRIALFTLIGVILVLVIAIVIAVVVFKQGQTIGKIAEVVLANTAPPATGVVA